MTNGNRISLKVILGISATLILLSSLGGCYYDIESDLYPAGLACDSMAISFSADVYPIISAKCLGCHDAASNSGSITIETYAQIKAQVDSGDLPCSINHQSGCSNMPKNSPQLPPCELKAINVWISEGALDN
jgi:hypothetical protein